MSVPEIFLGIVGIIVALLIVFGFAAMCTNMSSVRDAPPIVKPFVSGDTEKFAREFLRAKLLAGWKPGEYVLNVSPVGVKVAVAGDYHLAMFSGMKDFWQFVPVLERNKELPFPFDVEADVADGERRFAVVLDGHSKTYVSEGGIAVREGYTCAVATPQEVCEVIRHAKHETADGEGERDVVKS